jgi:hypothetical protein
MFDRSVVVVKRGRPPDDIEDTILNTKPRNDNK